MVLSDRTIRRQIDEGRIGIDPYDAELLQPSSLDVRVDRYFRVFRNSRYPFIDVKEPQEELTELDRKSTRLNSSHTVISYAVFCLKKKRTEVHPLVGALLIQI